MKNLPKRFKLQQRQKMTLRTLVAVSAFALFLATTGLFTYFNLGQSKQSYAAASGDYRSVATGNWSSLTTWEKFDGTSWLPATTVPSSTDGIITLQSPFVVTVTASITVDQVVVDPGAQLNLTNGTFSVADGSGPDLDVAGTINIDKTLSLLTNVTFTLSGTASESSSGIISKSSGATLTILSGGVFNFNGGSEPAAGWVVNNGGTYVHNVDGKVIPTATWGASSTLKITGVVSSNITGTYQDFGNVIYDCPNQTCCPGFGSGSTLEFSNDLKTIAGDFTVLNTGTGGTWLQKNSSATPVVISGNYFQSGGTMFMSKGATFSWNLMGNFTITGGTFVQAERYAAPTLNVYGNFLIAGGTFNHSSYNSNVPGEGIGTVNLYGNYLRTGGLHTESATSTGHGEFNFTKTGTQTFKHTGGSITNTVNFTVASGSVTDLATYMITGDGTFTLQSGGGLIMASVNGITSSGASGNVQVTGTRSFSTGGDYTYNATAAQVTGNGLPAVIHNLTIDNASGVTLSGSTSATHQITLTNGKVTTTSSYELGITNAETTSITGYALTRYVIGNLRRTISSNGTYDYPLGTPAYYEPGTIAFSGATGFTDVLGTFTNANPITPSHPLVMVHTNGSLLTDMLDYGYWTFTPNSAMSGGTYTITISETGASNVDPNPLTYCVLKRIDVNNDWTSVGTHNNNTQSVNGNTVTAARSNLAAFSDFGIGKSSYGSLPIHLNYFTARLNQGIVNLSWSTATEVNNNFFTVERSKDGESFEALFTRPGAGNSTTTLNYSAKDTRPLQGYSYYRLKQTDFDGHYTYSRVETIKNGTGSINDAGQLEIKSISPNPFTDNFRLTFLVKDAGLVDLTIMSTSGQLIRQEKIQCNEGFNTYDFQNGYNLRKGTYIIVLTANNQRVTQKVVRD